MNAKTLNSRLFHATLSAALALGLPTCPLAEDLTLARYVDLSIARLELSRQAWIATRQPPTKEAAATLFTDFGIDEASYLEYTSAHREAIDVYLAEHPQARQRIDDLSIAIGRAIAE